MKQDQVLITQLNTKTSREKRTQVGNSNQSRPEQSSTTYNDFQIRSSDHMDAVNSSEPIGVMKPYRKLLQSMNSKVTSLDCQSRIVKRLNSHWFKVESRVKRFDRALENKRKLEEEDEMRRTHFDNLWDQRKHRSAELKERVNRSRIDMAKGGIKHHFELLEKRSREREYQKYEKVREEKRKVESESEKSWSGEKGGQKVTDPETLQGININSARKYTRRPLSTYQDACDKKLQLWQLEYARGQMQSRDLAQRTEKALSSHQKALQQRKEQFSQLDSRIKLANDKVKEHLDDQQEHRVQTFLTKFDKFQMRHTGKDLELYFQERRVKESEKIKVVKENIKKQDEEYQEKQFRLTGKLFQPRVRSVSLGSHRLVSNNSEVLLKQNLIKHRHNQKNNYILMRNARKTESNQLYREMMSKIQQTGNYYNFKFDQQYSSSKP